MIAAPEAVLALNPALNPAPDPVMADGLLAARLFIASPLASGGISLRGSGPVRDRLLACMIDALEEHQPVVKIPLNVDTEQLFGGLDLPSTLAAGAPVHRAGLLQRARGGVALVRMAERVADNVAAHLSQAVDHGELAIILLDDGIEPDEAPPKSLLDRAAYHCDLNMARSIDFKWSVDGQPAKSARALLKSQRQALSSAAAALGVHSMRPALFAEKCARLHALLNGSVKVSNEDLQAAVRLVLAPRATQFPELEEPATTPQTEAESSIEGYDSVENEPIKGGIPLEDILLEAAVTAIPKDVLSAIDRGISRVGQGRMGRSGQKEKSAKRGRPLGSRPGVPGNGRKLALIDTLRAAAPWQSFRRAGGKEKANRTLKIRKSDLRVRQFEQRRETLTIFTVDASGSAALARLAEAKGAVELMLAQAHVKRSQVALIAFRQKGAEVLLPPTRSLTRARRVLSALPGGGGTPIAAGLRDARMLADAARKNGQTPVIAVLTDGKANVAIDGTANRTLAMEETRVMAKGIAAAGHHAIVIDISPRPRDEAAQLAQMLRGKYLALPNARSAAMAEAIESVGNAARQTGGV